jgi:Peptidase S46
MPLQCVSELPLQVTVEKSAYPMSGATANLELSGNRELELTLDQKNKLPRSRLQSLVWNLCYDDRQARVLSVDSRGIVEALSKIYGADSLVNEPTGTKSARHAVSE